MILYRVNSPFSNKGEMKRVCANFIIGNVRTNIAPPAFDDWGKYKNPDHKDQAVFSFSDNKGEITLIVRYENIFEIKVCGEVADDVIDVPDPENIKHQDAIIDFYARAFSVLNNFILRHRLHAFEYQSVPIKWRASKLFDPASGKKSRQFYAKQPIEMKVSWTVEDVPSTQPEKVNLRVWIDRSTSTESFSYKEETLDLIYDEVCRLIKGKQVGDPVYETSLELLLHAQELIVNEQEEREEERTAVISAALITTASACEVFVRNFVRRHGTKLHKFIMKHKRNSFSVMDLLGEVLKDIPSIKNSLGAENAELGNNIYYLFDARNNSSHRGEPVITIKHKVEEADDDGNIKEKEIQTKCPIRGWMIYSRRDIRPVTSVSSPTTCLL